MHSRQQRPSKQHRLSASRPPGVWPGEAKRRDRLVFIRRSTAPRPDPEPPERGEPELSSAGLPCRRPPTLRCRAMASPPRGGGAKLANWPAEAAAEKSASMAFSRSACRPRQEPEPQMPRKPSTAGRY